MCFIFCLDLAGRGCGGRTGREKGKGMALVAPRKESESDVCVCFFIDEGITSVSSDVF